MRISFIIIGLSLIILGSVISLSTDLNMSIYAKENQTGTTNEAEIEADIEQENKCKNDTECENENEINNQLTVTNNGTQTSEQPVIPTCEDCFTDNLSSSEIEAFIIALNGILNGTGGLETLEQLCEFIEQNQGTSELNDQLISAAESTLSEEQYQALIECLHDAGIDVDFGIPLN